ncbi:MAG: hydrogenase iron-sulfur subunit, partial [Candidatus Limnocylindrales bacterium]
MSAVAAPEVLAPAAGPPTERAYEPVIIGFTCNWCSYRAADMAGMGRIKYAPNVRLIRLMCSGRLDLTFILKAF